MYYRLDTHSVPGPTEKDYLTLVAYETRKVLQNKDLEY